MISLEIDKFEAFKKRNNFEEEVYTLKLKYGELEKLLDISCEDSDSRLYELPPGEYEIVVFTNTLQTFLTVTIGDNTSGTFLVIEPSLEILGSSKSFFSILFLSLQISNIAQDLPLELNQLLMVKLLKLIWNVIVLLEVS